MYLHIIEIDNINKVLKTSLVKKSINKNKLCNLQRTTISLGIASLLVDSC